MVWQDLAVFGSTLAGVAEVERSLANPAQYPGRPNVRQTAGLVGRHDVKIGCRHKAGGVGVRSVSAADWLCVLLLSVC